MSHTAYIGLGSNLDSPQTQITSGFTELGALPGTRLVAHSRLYRSAPMGYANQPDFVNAVACLTTELDPEALLDALLAIEIRHGRQREFPNSPRTLDLDVLLYDDRCIETARLTIPHPRMGIRAFVLRPLAEIAPALEIPGQGTVGQLLLRCADQDAVPMEPLPAS
ncbi:MAG: 2-amino-4-hydroxy-6-hydroxymethyldihydropteridine diphosphokinase [Betaproteobacteria bacterium]|nr:2-amino-4-hydroxy-6-hydroxymethyldihydropteridine diphosphokinase [Betaproteobacteria bacterium]MDE2622281.1 2-amino-4-hydroxy-6-hydroxymethyldihydropteridine diphosphokinase [Betaproteobacteria bacterium]